MKTIGVTAATGGVGSRTVRELLARGSDVIALARRPEAVSATEARSADYDDPASLRRAFAGLDTLVFISSDGVVETMVRHHEHVVAAAIDAGVPHVVYTSIVDIAPDSRFYYSPGHQDTEAWLRASGIRCCFARTSIFADFFVETWLAAETLAVNAGAGGMSLVTRDDTAAVLAAAAADGLEGVIDVTGPEALTAAEVAAIAGVAYEPLEDEEYRRRLAAQGNPGWLIDAFSSMFRSVVEGRFAVVSDDVARLTGRPQQPFADFLRREIAGS
jgi:NAD(P)H dehydrogenase (quinone)